jgi:hypothetical protein
MWGVLRLGWVGAYLREVLSPIGTYIPQPLVDTYRMHTASRHRPTTSNVMELTVTCDQSKRERARSERTWMALTTFSCLN